MAATECGADILWTDIFKHHYEPILIYNMKMYKNLHQEAGLEIDSKKNFLTKIGRMSTESKIKKYRKAEYVQRRVCFVNVQSPLHENVVFSVCARMFCYIYHVEFHFRFRHLLSFLVKHQLWSGCHGGRSFKKTSGNFLRGGYGGGCF